MHLLSSKISGKSVNPGLRQLSEALAQFRFRGGDVIPCGGYHIALSRQLKLKNDMPVVFERANPAGQIELPHSEEPLAI